VVDVGVYGDADAGGPQWPGNGTPRLLPTDSAAVVADEGVPGDGEDGASAAACRPPARVSFLVLVEVPAAVPRQPMTSASLHTAD